MTDLQQRFKGREDLLQSATNVLLIYRESHLNFALCHIKLSDYESAIEILTMLLHYEPQNVKALYLRGKCFNAVRNFHSALVDMRLAKSLKPLEQGLFDHYLEEIDISLKNT